MRLSSKEGQMFFVKEDGVHVGVVAASRLFVVLGNRWAFHADISIHFLKPSITVSLPRHKLHSRTGHP